MAPVRGVSGRSYSSGKKDDKKDSEAALLPSKRQLSRAKVKQYHPDVNKEGSNSDIMIRGIIQAYEMLTNYSRSEIIEGYTHNTLSAKSINTTYKWFWNATQNDQVMFVFSEHTRECLDPFYHPEREALDVFVKKVLCVGKSTKISSSSLKLALLVASFLLEHLFERGL